MVKWFSLVCRLIALEWQLQLYESSVWGYIRIERTVASGYQTKFMSVVDVTELS
jgi:hypothetical protein